MRVQPHWQALILVIVTLTALANLGTLHFMGLLSVDAGIPSLKMVTFISAVIFVLWLGFDHYGWLVLQKLGILHRPNLNGEWTGTGAYSSSTDHDLSNGPIQIEVKISIKQTYTRIWVNYWCANKSDPTKETISHGRGELIRESTNGQFVLQYIFRTLPGADNPLNPGMALLTFLSQPSRRLIGVWIADPRAPASGSVEVTQAS